MDCSIEAPVHTCIPDNTAEARDTEIDGTCTYMQQETSKLVRVYVSFLLMFQTVFRLSDQAMDVLFHFLYIFLNTAAQQLHCQKLNDLFIKLPKHIRGARALFGGRERFLQYVCCPSCHSIYLKDNCIQKNTNGTESTSLCTYVKFPKHPRKDMQKPCNMPLLRNIRSISGSYTLRPHLIYSYCSLIASLQALLLRPGFIEECELWRNNFPRSGNYTDVYDGQIWKDFQSYNG